MHSHKILKIAKPLESLCTKLSKELQVSEILAQILINRNITTAPEAEKFLNISTAHFLDPFQFSDMHKAVALVKNALGRKEKIMVFGDYDADGITALGLVKETLKKQGGQVEHYLPHRIREGYGLNKNIARIAAEKKVKLLITVDCGISNHKEIEELRKSGIEVIITDHHEPSSAFLPPASSVLDPKLASSGYKYRELAGVGVAYKFCQALTNSVLPEELDLVCLGTIADSVPLTGENRIIAKEGLLRMSQTKRVGLRVLIERAGIKDKKFTSTFVSFILAPRINASGRMDSAEASLDLLLSTTVEEADKCAQILEDHNRQRQKIEGRILEEAKSLIATEVNFKEHKVMVLAKEDWHQGVLGIVASKLADRFYRPAIVISMGEDLCKGSARSIKNFHIFQALSDSRQFLDNFGGHSHAAGLLINKKAINDFRQNINRLAHERLSVEDLLPSVDIDLEINFADLNEEIVFELERLQPFGNGNPKPLFYTKNLKVKGQPQILSRDTLKFWVTDGSITFQAIGFGMGSLAKSVSAAESFDLVYTPKIDNWQGDTQVLLEIEDIFLK